MRGIRNCYYELVSLSAYSSFQIGKSYDSRVWPVKTFGIGPPAGDEHCAVVEVDAVGFIILLGSDHGDFARVADRGM